MDYLPLSVCCFGFGAHGTVFKGICATWKKNLYTRILFILLHFHKLTF